MLFGYGYKKISLPLSYLGIGSSEKQTYSKGNWSWEKYGCSTSSGHCTPKATSHREAAPGMRWDGAWSFQTCHSK